MANVIRPRNEARHEREEYRVGMVAFRRAHLRTTLTAVLLIAVLIALHLIAIHGHQDATALEVCMVLLVQVIGLYLASFCRDLHVGASTPTIAVRVISVRWVRPWVPADSGMVMRH